MLLLLSASCLYSNTDIGQNMQTQGEFKDFKNDNFLLWV